MRSASFGGALRSRCKGCYQRIENCADSRHVLQIFMGDHERIERCHGKGGQDMLQLRVLRAGDYFGPGMRASWFGQAMVKPEKPLHRIVNPARGRGHSWAYLPDVAEAVAQLLDMPEQLLAFERLQFEGLFDDSGTSMTKALSRAAGKDLPVRWFPWWLVPALAVFGGFPREVAAVAPYWRSPVRLDNTHLTRLLGHEPQTELYLAVQQTLVSLNCVKV